MHDPSRPLFMVGHSYGGHALGVLPNHQLLDAFYVFGTGSGWRGWMPPLERLRIVLLWNLVGPLVTRWKGYLPFKRMGVGENLPLMCPGSGSAGAAIHATFLTTRRRENCARRLPGAHADCRRQLAGRRLGLAALARCFHARLPQRRLAGAHHPARRPYRADWGYQFFPPQLHSGCGRRALDWFAQRKVMSAPPPARPSARGGAAGLADRVSAVIGIGAGDMRQPARLRPRCTAAPRPPPAAGQGSECGLRPGCPSGRVCAKN